ncbi:flagellar hook-basal body complex protein FliE [Kineobactrum sediminis]|uniref:Flagellar hook-basal body complex protein FliE n=1 Tax=Kineobactrum sediminis TaxID=1905677 RepID=A0A2N5Y6F0_9GAMM|nr:flagellar hook-basal body complex protein FliE [Kineobactrum sediminis]PLW83975.1 flagellar hook-basal body complex protein FliE [Kineobactrum sediminis]
MSDMTIQQVLTQMRQLKIEAGAEVQATEGSGKPGFAELLNRSIEQVSDNQQASGQMSAAFERGDPGVDLASVMIAGQKSRISFEAMMQVRNRLVEAYREIQNMPI